MKLLFIDVDSLRPDHLGCYGYHRNTSPNIDRIAERGIRFTKYYASDAPCKPSRTAFTTGKFGIRTGVVDHGGKATNLRNSEKNSDFKDGLETFSLPGILRQKGLETVLVSTFHERHSAWHFAAGWNQIFNCGKLGDEIASEVTPIALKWLKSNTDKDNWCLYLNYWDPHTPYRTPESYGKPFRNDPLPDWLTKEKLEKDRQLAGPHSAREVDMYWNKPLPEYPRYPTEIKDMDDMRKLIDGYDTGIRYMDDHLGQIFEELDNQGILDEVAVIITGDHGENLGELGIYAEHATADKGTCNIPMILSLPEMKDSRIDDNFHYNMDILPTLAEWLNVEADPEWDAKSFAPALSGQSYKDRKFLVISQCSHVCQRSVLFDKWLYIRTYHDGFHLFEKHMLFDLEEDPYEQHNLAETREDIVREAIGLLNEWHDEMMAKMTEPVDPLWTVMNEGGPYHAKGNLEMYINQRLLPTGRTEAVEKLKQAYPNEFKV
ncbi:sulfatase family protein [Marinilactibacillus psychrotolerans]|uniref:sulfatase family protein n=1 Tax=Marinilactibacillus psychrotolerans TaxID=191770 RepID=UPI00388628D8